MKGGGGYGGGGGGGRGGASLKSVRGFFQTGANPKRYNSNSVLKPDLKSVELLKLKAEETEEAGRRRRWSISKELSKNLLDEENIFK